MASSQINGLPKDRPVSISSTTDNSSAELSAVVDELLTSLSTKFSNVSSEIFAKMDEMSKRLDNLEASLQSSSERKRSPTK